MARYTVLRLMIFFGLLCALWLVGLRDVSERWWLLGLAALGSTVVSFFVLRGPRAQFSASIARHVDDRAGRAVAAQTNQTNQTDQTDQTDQIDEDDEESARA